MATNEPVGGHKTTKTVDLRGITDASDNVSAGPIPFREIEWIELDPATQRAQEHASEAGTDPIRAALTEAVESARLVASDAGDGRVRVWGYR